LKSARCQAQLAPSPEPGAICGGFPGPFRPNPIARIDPLPFPDTSVTLITRLGEGPVDPAAWARFVIVYGPHIIRWCRSYGLQPSDADDVAQEVLLQLSRQMHQFRLDPSKRFRGWLRKVVHGAWYAWSTNRRPWDEGTGDDLVHERLAAEAARDDLLTRIDAQFDRELFEIASESIRRRVEARSWEAFRLLAIEGIPGQEVADQLAIGVHAAINARYRIQKMIREEIARLDPPEPLVAGPTHLADGQ